MKCLGIFFLTLVLSASASAIDKCNPNLKKPTRDSLICFSEQTHQQVIEFKGSDSVRKALVGHEAQINQIIDALDAKQLKPADAMNEYLALNQRLVRYMDEIIVSDDRNIAAFNSRPQIIQPYQQSDRRETSSFQPPSNTEPRTIRTTCSNLYGHTNCETR